ncbi:transcriptional regulator, TetR family [Paraburkholderia steynii]|uniref:Transcriptional regulator, TetR family n=1 Tax=Paraburkholderia steynii TaxID=1245441 RepID=A0A7Z7FJK7_9BURK|nr:TetR/AcrR family transcriptional regulator [Paraburkholderia steynii]SDI56717.1 transcriptional regulator, TetR family [Paraburkholderia steynii]
MIKRKELVAERPTRNSAQRKAILDKASIAFIEKGFAGANLHEIADAAGLTRTAVYHYFPSKESMLEALTEEVTNKASLLAESVVGRDELPADKALHQLIVLHAGLILSHPLQFRVVERSESSLPEPHRSAAQSARRAVFDHFLKVIRRGINDGRFRAVDAHVTAFSIIGMCNWCAWWFDPAGDLSAEDVSNMIADLGLHAVLPDKPRKSRAPSVEDTFKLIKDSLGLLERQICKPE